MKKQEQRIGDQLLSYCIAGRLSSQEPETGGFRTKGNLDLDLLFKVLLPGFVSLVTACSSYHIMETGLAFDSFWELGPGKRLRLCRAYGPSFQFLDTNRSSSLAM